MIITLLCSSSAFAIDELPNPFIDKSLIVQATKIAGLDKAYCVSTAAGTLITNKTEAGYFEIVDSKVAKKEVNSLIKQYKKKLAKAKTAKQRKKILKQIAKYEKTLVSIQTCLKFDVKTLACEIFAGKTFSGINPMVINGAQCTNQNKSVVAKIVLDYGGKEDDSGLCTGTLIGKNVFLTAAHCFKGFQMSAIGPQLPKVNVTIAGKTYVATKWVVNPFWSGNSESGDTALVYIKKNLSKTPLKLIAKDYEPDQGDFAAMIGYGVAKYKNNNTPITGYYGGFATLSSITESGLSSIYSKKSKQSTICFGDSGGPLVSWINKAWRIMGTATGGIGDNYCGFYSGSQLARWSKINSPENVAFLEEYLPGIFE